MAFMSALEAFNLHAETGEKIVARMPDGGRAYAVDVVRNAEDGTFTFRTGWGSCTLDANDTVEVSE